MSDWGFVLLLCCIVLSFSAHKIRVIVSIRKLKYDTPSISTGGTAVALETQIKILDVIVDSKITFNGHIAYVCRRTTNIYSRLSTMARVIWWLCPEIIKTIYVTVIEPNILYGTSAWAEATKKSLRKVSQ